MFLLMTIPDIQITMPKAKEYLQLQHPEELKIMKRQIPEEDEHERLLARKYERLVALIIECEQLTASVF